MEVLDLNSLDKADLLASCMKDILEGSASVSRPTCLDKFKMSSFDPSITSGDIRDTIASFGKCSVNFIKVCEVRCLPGGFTVAWIECPGIMQRTWRLEAV